MDRTGHIGLLMMELPDGAVLMCTEGFQQWGASTFHSHHAIFGRIASVSSLQEGVGDEVPAHEIVFQPAGDAELGDLSRPGDQGGRVRFWLGKYDLETHALIGTPDLQFDGQIDQTVLKIGAVRELAMTVVSSAERLFAGNTGNSLSPTWHKSVWPGETGHDNATGLSVPVAWGTERPRTVTPSYSPAYGPGGQRGDFYRGWDYR